MNNLVKFNMTGLFCILQVFHITIGDINLSISISLFPKYMISWKLLQVYETLKKCSSNSKLIYQILGFNICIPTILSHAEGV